MSKRIGMAGAGVVAGGSAAADITRAAVIGAGVMGAGIAAHLANAGLSVVLLDLPAAGPRRSQRAEDAVARQLATGGFMQEALARRVVPGNTDDDFALLADADWIVEAVAERIDIKRALFARLDEVRKPHSVVSSNTSTLPLAALTEGLPERFARDFLVTHFFNPPRQMRLLEIVAGAQTRPEVVDRISRFADVALGKGVVHCKDRPGFVANRIGCFWIAAAVSEAVALGLSVEEADAVIGRPFGIPPTGVFGLLDLVGIDLMPPVWDSLARNLPPDDPLRRFDLDPPIIRSMMARGLMGRKSGGGFHRVAKDGAARLRQTIDLGQGEYREARPAALDSLALAKDPRALLDHPDRGGRYAWRVMGPMLAYAAWLIPEIADEPQAADTAMRLGYGWAQGPFELIDALGPAWLAGRLAAAGEAVPPFLADAVSRGRFYRSDARGREELLPGQGYRAIRRPEGVVSLADIKAASSPIAANRAASLWDIGDGVACLEFHTKANAFDTDLLAMVEIATTVASEGCRALVLGNDAPGFSAGADLSAMLDAIRRGDWPWIEALIDAGQWAFGGLRRAPIPVVAAVAGSTLGGGCEVALHCDAIQAHAELTMGLVEARVGLLPGWGGCRELLRRQMDAQGDEPATPGAPALAAFRTIIAAKCSSSAFEARELGFLRANDGVTMNRERLLADAKAAALRLAEDYRPPAPRFLALSGPSGARALLDGFDAEPGPTEPHDRLVAELLSAVLTGGPVGPGELLPEGAISDLERQAFLQLVRCDASRERIQRLLGRG